MIYEGIPENKSNIPEAIPVVIPVTNQVQPSASNTREPFRLPKNTILRVLLLPFYLIGAAALCIGEWTERAISKSIERNAARNRTQRPDRTDVTISLSPFDRTYITEMLTSRMSMISGFNSLSNWRWQ